MHGLARIAALALVVLTAGCAPWSRPSSDLRASPLPDRPIDLAGRCEQTEEDGFTERALLEIRNSQVQALSWRIEVGHRGSCRFELSDFRQVRSRPSIELAERGAGACKLMVWQVPERVTLAHADCERYCTPGIADQAWPVMFDSRSGACAQTRKQE